MGLLIFSCKRSLEIGNSEVDGGFHGAARGPGSFCHPVQPFLACGKQVLFIFIRNATAQGGCSPGSCLYSRWVKGDPAKTKDG